MMVLIFGACLVALHGPVVRYAIPGAWPRGLPSKLPGLRRIEGQGDPGMSGETWCRIGPIRDDGTFWGQPLILHEPPRLCTWDSTAIGFTASKWRRKAIALMRQRVAGRKASVQVGSAKRWPWIVNLTVLDSPSPFILPVGLIDFGYARSRDPMNLAYGRIMEDAKRNRRGMFARR